MRNLKSIAAAFTFAATIFGFGRMSSAEAQTVPINPIQDSGTYYQPPVSGTFVSQESINEVAQTYGVQTPYYRAGVGFSSGLSSYGENVGLEFRLRGNMGTVVRAYNLNVPEAAEQFQTSMDRAAQIEMSLMHNNNYQTYPSHQVAPMPYPLPPVNPFWFDPAYNNVNQHMFPSASPNGGHYFYIPK